MKAKEIIALPDSREKWLMIRAWKRKRKEQSPLWLKMTAEEEKVHNYLERKPEPRVLKIKRKKRVL